MMEIVNKWDYLTYLGAARRLRITVWRVRYAVDCGFLSPPSVVLRKRRLFSPEQLVDMQRFFDLEEAMKRERLGEGS
jgi:hypothetical protein